MFFPVFLTNEQAQQSAKEDYFTPQGTRQPRRRKFGNIGVKVNLISQELKDLCLSTPFEAEHEVP